MEKVTVRILKVWILVFFFDVYKISDKVDQDTASYLTSLKRKERRKWHIAQQLSSQVDM